MDRDSLGRLLALLDAAQVENGSGLDVPAERWIAIAGGAPVSAEEVRVLLTSPLARQLLRLAPAVLQANAGSVPSPMRMHVFPLRLAASTATADAALPPLGIGPQRDGAAAARLTIERGFGGALAWLLRLTLDPALLPGGKVAGRQVRISEPGPGGFVWLEGTTDAAGRLTGHWPEPGPTPAERLAGLPDRQLDVEIG